MSKIFKINGRFIFKSGEVKDYSSVIEGASIYDALSKSWIEEAVGRSNEWPLQIHMSVTDTIVYRRNQQWSYLKHQNNGASAQQMKDSLL